MNTFQKILTLFIGIGAVGGAVMMWVDPTGASWGGEPLLELLRAKMPWADGLHLNVGFGVSILSVISTSSLVS